MSCSALSLLSPPFCLQLTAHLGPQGPVHTIGLSVHVTLYPQRGSLLNANFMVGPGSSPEGFLRNLVPDSVSDPDAFVSRSFLTSAPSVCRLFFLLQEILNLGSDSLRIHGWASRGPGSLWNST